MIVILNIKLYVSEIYMNKLRLILESIDIDMIFENYLKVG